MSYNVKLLGYTLTWAIPGERKTDLTDLHRHALSVGFPTDRLPSQKKPKTALAQAKGFAEKALGGRGKGFTFDTIADNKDVWIFGLIRRRADEIGVTFDLSHDLTITYDKLTGGISSNFSHPIVDTLRAKYRENLCITGTDIKTQILTPLVRDKGISLRMPEVGETNMGGHLMPKGAKDPGGFFWFPVGDLPLLESLKALIEGTGAGFVRVERDFGEALEVDTRKGQLTRSLENDIREILTELSEVDEETVRESTLHKRVSLLQSLEAKYTLLRDALQLGAFAQIEGLLAKGFSQCKRLLGQEGNPGEGNSDVSEVIGTAENPAQGLPSFEDEAGDTLAQEPASSMGFSPAEADAELGF